MLLISLNFNSKISSKNTITIQKNQLSLEAQLLATSKILTLKSERRVLKHFCMLWTPKLKFQADLSISLSIWLSKVYTAHQVEVLWLVVLLNKEKSKSEIQLNSMAIIKVSNLKSLVLKHSTKLWTTERQVTM